MDSDDVGGGWILVTPGADTCAITPPTPPTTDTTDINGMIPYVAGAGIIALVVGYAIGSSKKRSK
jgi:hypothetical protein